MIVILHNIRSIHNVGSIFRTADAAGVEKIYLCGITPSPLDRFGKINPRFAKVSLGAERTVAWEKCRRAGDVIKKLKKDGFKILAIEQDEKAIPYNRADVIASPAKRGEAIPVTGKEIASSSRRGGTPCNDDGTNGTNEFALILGNEIRGLPRSILNKCDKILEIPMRGQKESLNVAVAFGIVVFNIKDVTRP